MSLCYIFRTVLTSIFIIKDACSRHLKDVISFSFASLLTFKIHYHSFQRHLDQFFFFRDTAVSEIFKFLHIHTWQRNYMSYQYEIFYIC